MTLRRELSVEIVSRAGARAHEIVDRRVAGPGVEGDRIASAVDQRDVGDAADIDHRDGLRNVEIFGERAVIGGHERRPLAARSDVSGAKVVGNRHGKPFRQGLAVADLDRQPRFRPMQHGLAVKADDGDVAFRDFIFCNQILDGLGVGARDQRFRLGQHAGPRRPLGERGRIGERAPQQRFLFRRIWPVARGPEPFDALAVGLDQRRVHAVERGSAHQANGGEKAHGVRFNPEKDLLHQRAHHGEEHSLPYRRQ